MDAQQFLAEFGHIANAQNGLVQLRKLVNYLALNGDLTERLDADQPSKELLRKVESDRDVFLKNHNLRIGKRKSADFEQLSYSLPKEWSLVQTKSLVNLVNGRAFKSSEWSKNGLPIIRIQNLNNPSATFNHFQGPLDEKHLVEPGDMLLSWSGTPGTSFGAFIWQGPRGALNQHIFKVIIYSDAINKDYLKLVINARLDNLIANARGGVGLKHVTKGQIESLDIPLPSPEEQARIVAKVDELVTLCDELEAQQQMRRTLQNSLRQTILQAVAASQSPHELRDNWQRLQANFEYLFSASEDVGDLRKTMSELAIYGALDSYRPSNDVSALDSYLVRLSSKKSGKRFAKITEFDEEVSLPSGWRWVLLEDLLAGSESGWSPKCEPEPRRGEEWGVLKVSAVTWGKFKPTENKRLPLSLEPRPECEVKPGDFMLSRANTAELVARSVIAPNDCPGKLLMSDKIVRLSFLDERLKPWVNLVNNSEYARAYYKARATGTSDSMRNVSRKVIHELPIPLPPLEIQDRILTSLNDLMGICDELERKTKARSHCAKHLAEASVSTLTGIAIEQKEEPMKAPQTELVAPVRLGTIPNIKAQAPLATILARHQGEMSAKDLWQRFGGEIDAFYVQLKIEVSHGWVQEPTPAEVLEK